MTRRTIRKPVNFDYLPRHWQVHRFGKRVAVHLGDGATAYMTAAEADELGATMVRMAYNINVDPEWKTTKGTFNGTITGREP